MRTAQPLFKKKHMTKSKNHQMNKCKRIVQRKLYYFSYPAYVECNKKATFKIEYWNPVIESQFSQEVCGTHKNVILRHLQDNKLEVTIKEIK